MEMCKKNWMPQVRGGTSESKDLQDSRGGGITANCGSTHHHYPGQRKAVGRRKQAASVKNGTETTPSGTWRNAEGHIHWTERHGPLASLNNLINDTN